jgi:hypothetical protein
LRTCVVALALPDGCANNLVLLTFYFCDGNEDYISGVRPIVTHPFMPKDLYVVGVLRSVGMNYSTKEVFVEERTSANVGDGWLV